MGQIFRKVFILLDQLQYDMVIADGYYAIGPKKEKSILIDFNNDFSISTNAVRQPES